MIRLTGGLLVWIGCSLGGLQAAAALHRRVRVLEDIGQGLELLERELALNRTALPELLERVSGRKTQQAKNLFVNCRAELVKGNSFSFSWNLSLEESRLGREECGLLSALAQVLGRYEAQGQVQALARVRRELESQTAQVREQARSLGRVYGVLGVTVGSFVSLLLV